MSNFSKQKNTFTSALYVFVFSSRLVAAMVAILISLFLLQPVEQALADEVVENEAPTEKTEEEIEPIIIETTVAAENVEVGSDLNTSTPEEENIDIIPSDDEPEFDTSEFETEEQEGKASSTNFAQSASQTALVSTTDVNSVPGSKDSTGDVSSSTTTTSSTTPISEFSSTTESGTEDSTNTVIATSTENDITESIPDASDGSVPAEENLPPPDTQVSAADTASTSPDNVDADADTINSTTTATTTPTVSEVVSESFVINDENRHQFSVNECVSVGNGAFYCSQSELAPEYVRDAVFVAPDGDGDTEIFVSLNGTKHQITHNQVDDNSPYYDDVSNRLVWHRLINDRYQIVSYSVESGEETVLTSASYNSMEPVAYGDATLWQAWIEDNWEIVRYEEGVTTQLTDNDTHDVAPHMRAGYVVWQTQFADGWKVAVYDTDKNSIEYVDGLDKSAIAENPRFVLVFDQVDKNGDTLTVGYDFDSKTAIRLGSLPQELPTEIPEPEQTGEEKALVQSIPSTREVKKDSSKDPVPSPGDSLNTASSTATVGGATASSTFDVVVPPLEPTIETEEMVSEVLEVEMEEVVASSSATTTKAVNDIPDVVIPPLATSTDDISG